MALGNTVRRETNISLEASKSFAFGIRFVDGAGVALDVSDAVVRLVSTQPTYMGEAEVFSVEAEHIGTGLVRFSLQAEDLALDPGSYPYDVTLVPATGYSVPILKGAFEIGSNTDTDTTNFYSDVQVGSDVTVELGNGGLVEVTIERVDGMYTAVVELINNFTEEMREQVDKAEAAASSSEYWANQTQVEIADLKDWMTLAGFPYWKGNKADFAVIRPDNNIMYLLVD